MAKDYLFKFYVIEIHIPGNKVISYDGEFGKTKALRHARKFYTRYEAQSRMRQWDLGYLHDAQLNPLWTYKIRTLLVCDSISKGELPSKEVEVIKIDKWGYGRRIETK